MAQPHGFTLRVFRPGEISQVYAWELNARNISASAFRLGELNPETRYVLEALRLEAPPLLQQLGEEVAVVDTNNPEELPEVDGRTKKLREIRGKRGGGGVDFQSECHFLI